MTLATQPHPKIAPISKRNARRLERRVGRAAPAHYRTRMPRNSMHVCASDHTCVLRRWSAPIDPSARDPMQAPAQRVAVQPRAVEIRTTLGTTSRSKIAPISGRNARRLERRVGRLVALARSLPACQNHTCMVPHGTTCQLVEPHATQNHLSTTDNRKESHRSTTSSWYGRAQRAASTTGTRTTAAQRAPA